MSSALYIIHQILVICKGLSSISGLRRSWNGERTGVSYFVDVSLGVAFVATDVQCYLADVFVNVGLDLCEEDPGQITLTVRGSWRERRDKNVMFFFRHVKNAAHGHP